MCLSISSTKSRLVKISTNNVSEFVDGESEHVVLGTSPIHGGKPDRPNGISTSEDSRTHLDRSGQIEELPLSDRNSRFTEFYYYRIFAAHSSLSICKVSIVSQIQKERPGVAPLTPFNPPLGPNVKFCTARDDYT